MPKNTLGDLNNHLFAELERLNDESLTAEEIDKEIERAKAVSTVAANVIQTANTVLRACEFKDKQLGVADLPRMLTDGA